MKVFLKVCFIYALVIMAAKFDPMDNYIDDMDYDSAPEYSDLDEFAPRALDQNDTTGAGLPPATQPVASIDAISSPVDVPTVTSIGAVAQGGQDGTINLTSNSEEENNRNYVKISGDLKAYEDAYKACLDNISDNDYSMAAIEKCVGVDYQFVYDDIDYEKRKILARADSSIRTSMITICYNSAGADLVVDNACDLVQQDTIDLLWNELNFDILLDYHRDKYIFVHAKMPEALFGTLLNKFKDLYAELSKLIEELYAHRDLTIMHLKRAIDERTADVNEKFEYQAGHPTPKLKKDVVTIEEVLVDQPEAQGWEQMYPQPDGYETPTFGDGAIIFSDWWRKRHLKDAQPSHPLAGRQPLVRNRRMRAAARSSLYKRFLGSPHPNNISFKNRKASLQRSQPLRVRPGAPSLPVLRNGAAVRPQLYARP